MASSSASKSAVGILIIIVLAICAYAFLTMPDQRTTGQRVGDAIDTLPQGVDKAGQQLERRTPGQKLGDKIKDATSNNAAGGSD